MQGRIWTMQKSYETHLSNAEYLVSKTPVVYTDQAVTRCMVLMLRSREE